MTKIDFIKSQNLIIGATGSGKTTFVRKVIKSTRFRFGVVITSTPWEYSTLRNAYVTDFDNIDQMAEILFKCSRKVPKFIVIDNFVGIYKIAGVVEKIFTQGRHFNIAVFLLTQYAAKCPAVCRENARYMWVFRSCVRSYELIFNNQNKYSKKADFIAFMQSVTGYEPVLINNADLSLKDNIFII